MDETQKDKLASSLGISAYERSVLDVGSEHAYRCTCAVCLDWWVQMGPDGGEAGNYGPFSEETVKEAALARGLSWPECHQGSEEE